MDLKLYPIFLLILLFFNGGNSECVNKKALFLVDAVVNRHWYEQSEKITNTNFYFLKNVTVIDVTQAIVPDLCEGMIIDFPKLEVLTLINVNLSSIQQNVFQNVPKLKQLSLALNDLTNIQAGSFNNLPSLEILYLSVNKISFIEENAFTNLENLRAVHLDRNKLVEINGNLFRDCLMINLINYNFNSIKRMPAAALKGIKPSHTNPISIFLSKNVITEVDGLKLDTTNPVNLYLKGNKISKFSDVFFSLKDWSKLYLNKNEIRCVSDDVLETMKNTTKDLHLSDNPIMCDCLERIKNVLYQINGQGQIHYMSTNDCLVYNTQPPNLFRFSGIVGF